MRKKSLGQVLAMVLVAASIVTAAPMDTMAALEPDEFGLMETESDYVDEVFTHNVQFAGCELIHGIDVSRWQGEIDWTKVKEDGIDFAFIRVGHRNGSDGVIEEDLYYQYNFENAIANDINVGAYIFSQATSQKEARQEANYVLKRIKNYNVTMPIVIDYEYDSSSSTGGRLKRANLSKAKATKIVRAFCKTIAKAGYQPMVYANINMLTTQLKPSSITSDYPIWLARYNDYAEYDGPYRFWQHSSNGRVDGIKGRVDLDFWYLNTNVATKKLKNAVRKTDRLKLSWKAIAGATGYEIYRAEEGEEEFEYVGQTNTTTFVDRELYSGTTYQYKVRANWVVGGETYSALDSDILLATTKPDRVEEVSVERRRKTSITIGWEEVDGATGYMVYRANKKGGKFRMIGKVSAEDELIYKDEELKSGKTYYYKVLAYKAFEGSRIKGAKSETLEVRTKGDVK